MHIIIYFFNLISVLTYAHSFSILMDILNINLQRTFIKGNFYVFSGFSAVCIMRGTFFHREKSVEYEVFMYVVFIYEVKHVQ